jgi:hypothetical protein
MRKKIYGYNHPDIAVSLNNIAIVFENIGENKKALECHEKSIQMTKIIYGPEHPTFVTSLNNIASVYDNL